MTGECAVLVIHRNLSISLELFRSGCRTLRSSFALLTSFWRMKFDMWQPSGLVDVMIKCCCCNTSGTWFVGVILIISGNSEYVIVCYWSLFGFVKICKDLQNSADLYTLLQKNVSSFWHKWDFSRVLNILNIHLTLLWVSIVFLGRSFFFESAQIRKDRKPAFCTISIVLYCCFISIVLYYCTKYSIVLLFYKYSIVILYKSQ